MEFNVPKKGWIGVGRSQSGRMDGSLAVIGLPGSGQVSKYLLYSYGADPSSNSTSITNALVTQTSTSTTLRFVQTLKDEVISLNPSGPAMFIFAIGCSNTFEKHCGYTSMQLTLSPCIPKVATKKPTMKPIKKPTMKPIKKPTMKPSKKPTMKPIKKPTKKPSKKPTMKPIKKPTKKPTVKK